MKKTSLFLFILYFSFVATAATEGIRSRLDISATTWQEPLRLTTSSGTVDQSFANFKGVITSFERLKYNAWGGYGVGALLGSGAASGGGTSNSVGYNQGSLPWTLAGVQPRVFYSLSDRVTVGASSALVYRGINWPGSDTVDVSPSKTFNVIFAVDLDLNLGHQLGFRQSWGAWSADAGPFWRWGLTYDFD